MTGEDKPKKRRGRPPGSGRKSSGASRKKAASKQGPEQGELFGPVDTQTGHAETGAPAGRKRSGRKPKPEKVSADTDSSAPLPRSASAERPRPPRPAAMAEKPKGLAGMVPPRWRRGISLGAALLVIGYGAVVLFVDAMASLGDDSVIYWSRFHWTLGDLARQWDLGAPWNWRILGMFDLYKALLWLAVPFLLSLPRMEWSWLSWRRMERRDAWFLAGLCVLGLVGIAATRFIPSLASIYPRGQFSGFGDRVLWLGMVVFWWLSWLPGWEFLHRYVLLRAGLRVFPRWGWIIVPLSETLYHLVKPLPETLGMAVFSVLATRYTMARRNLTAPFLAHLAIEAALALLMLT